MIEKTTGLMKSLNKKLRDKGHEIKYVEIMDWAEREVDYAIKREKELSNNRGGDFMYGVECYKSALKAYNSLVEDGHSGYSINATKCILMNLIDHKPLVPIIDDPEMWIKARELNDKGYVSYQNLRYSGLFKHVYSDGKIEYVDIDRTPRYNGFINHLINEMYPIEFPYMPGIQFEVRVADILYDPKTGGDYDTLAILDVTKPDGTVEEIGRYFKENDHTWKEIDFGEYIERLNVYIARVNEKENE